MNIQIGFFFVIFISQTTSAYYVLRIDNSETFDGEFDFDGFKGKSLYLDLSLKNIQPTSQKVIALGADNIRDQIIEYARQIKTSADRNPTKLLEIALKLKERASDLRHQGQDLLADEIQNFIKSVKDEECENYLSNALTQNTRIYQQTIAEIWQLAQNF